MTMLCKSMDKLELPLFLTVSKDKWVGEVKQDGDRVRMRVQNKQITLFNRRGKDVTQQYPEFKTIDLEDCFLDGETCVLDEDGVSQFNTGISFRTHCKNADTIRRASKEYPVTYVVFDVMEFAGENMRTQPLCIRRETLELMRIAHPNIILNEQTPDIIGLWQSVVERGEEGIILKHVDSLYTENKRSPNWIKVKDVKEATLKFVKFKEHNMGARVETEQGIAITVNGYQSAEVMNQIQTKGECQITIRHLGETENGKFRQPVFFKIEEGTQNGNK